MTTLKNQNYINKKNSIKSFLVTLFLSTLNHHFDNFKSIETSFNM